MDCGPGNLPRRLPVRLTRCPVRSLLRCPPDCGTDCSVRCGPGCSPRCLVGCSTDCLAGCGPHSPADCSPVGSTRSLADSGSGNGPLSLSLSHYFLLDARLVLLVSRLDSERTGGGVKMGTGLRAGLSPFFLRVCSPASGPNSVPLGVFVVRLRVRVWTLCELCALCV